MISFWYGVNRMRSLPAASARSATLRQDGAGHPARDRGDADGVESVLELLHADVVDGARHRLGRGAVDELALQVLVLENLTEFLDAPVLDQELQPGLGPQPAVAVVAEHR